MSINIFLADQKGPFKLAGFHSPNDKTYYGFDLRPANWIGSTVYHLDQGYAMPTVPNGFYYKVDSPGASDATEPTWPTSVAQKILDGSVTWEAVAFNLMPTDETVVASAWAVSDLVTISGGTFTPISTQIKVDAVPTGTTTFVLTNTITKSNGEIVNRSLRLIVSEQ